MTRIFIQGDRDTAGNEAQAVEEICRLCAEKGITILAGAYGQIVRIAHESGAKVISHSFRAGDKGEIPEGVEFIDCTSPDGDRARGWGKRIGELLAQSDGAIFLPGRVGTLAHLFSFIAFAVKRGGLRIALIGWDKGAVESIFNLSFLSHDFGPIASYDLSGAIEAIKFVSWIEG